MSYACPMLVAKASGQTVRVRRSSSNETQAVPKLMPVGGPGGGPRRARPGTPVALALTRSARPPAGPAGDSDSPADSNTQRAP
jgi:hypothetical protein